VNAVGLSLDYTDILVSCAVRDEWMTYIILLVYRPQCCDMGKALTSFFLKDWLTPIFLSIANLIIATLRHFPLPPKRAEVPLFCSFYLRYNGEKSSPTPHQNEQRRKKSFFCFHTGFTACLFLLACATLREKSHFLKHLTNATHVLISFGVPNAPQTACCNNLSPTRIKFLILKFSGNRILIIVCILYSFPLRLVRCCARRNFFWGAECTSDSLL
jgi:hypothetical protein